MVKLEKMLTDIFYNTRFKLPCTATPSPNDFVELGTHSEFLNNYTVSEMKMMYFTQDRANVQDFILKVMQKVSSGSGWLRGLNVYQVLAI